MTATQCIRHIDTVKMKFKQNEEDLRFKWLSMWHSCWVGWSEHFRNWDFPTQQAIGFTGNGPKKWKYPFISMREYTRGQRRMITLLQADKLVWSVSFISVATIGLWGQNMKAWVYPPLIQWFKVVMVSWSELMACTSICASSMLGWQQRCYVGITLGWGSWLTERNLVFWNSMTLKEEFTGNLCIRLR